MRILVIVNLFPPLHAGTFEFRCEAVTALLQKRGHEIHVLTSKYGLNTEQRDPEIARRLILNGRYEQPLVTGFGDLKQIEEHNNDVVRETIQSYQPELIYVWSLQGISKSIVFTLRNTKIPTVYDVADDWILHGLREDPWLRWWNRPKAPVFGGIWRSMLELTRQRDKINARIPTQLTKGYDRVPEVYGDPINLEIADSVQPGSIGAFHFDRLYFCSQALKEETDNAGFRVAHAEVIYPGIPTEKFWTEPRPVVATPKKFLIVSRLTSKSGVMTALQAVKLARENNVPANLSVYGRGESEQMAQMRSYVIQHSLPVEFLAVSNQQKDLAQIYRQHDAFIYCAEWDEPFAVTPLEAMASGIPVIAAGSGGVRELLRSGENGWV
ncbi:MAG TPA: glycosyltransferase family 4 protein, partial [Verrucomicrobiae bacterium]|nr:glycosyltransferase family 4 protein [Verrucomicrobiae bacterium]